MNPIQLIIAFSIVATVSARLPWVFYVKLNDTFVPLTGLYLGRRFGNMSMFVYGADLGDPTEFAIDGKQIYTTQHGDRLYAKIVGRELVFGPGVPETNLEMNLAWKLRTSPFYSCCMLDGVGHGIMNPVLAERVPYCFKVDIYFMPYDTETKSLVRPVSPSQLAGLLPDNDAILPLELKAPCGFNYHGKHARENLDVYLHYYKGECKIYIQGQLVYDKRVLK